ncbi:MAG: hypothetical protein PHC92_10495 [Syntrophomonadaceae bacterium]|nr:hypothetical protein [Syntrophomonadaceae bacterium]
MYQYWNIVLLYYAIRKEGAQIVGKIRDEILIDQSAAYFSVVEDIIKEK